MAGRPTNPKLGERRSTCTVRAPRAVATTRSRRSENVTTPISASRATVAMTVVTSPPMPITAAMPPAHTSGRRRERDATRGTAAPRSPHHTASASRRPVGRAGDAAAATADTATRAHMAMARPPIRCRTERVVGSGSFTPVAPTRLVGTAGWLAAAGSMDAPGAAWPLPAAPLEPVGRGGRTVGPSAGGPSAGGADTSSPVGEPPPSAAFFRDRASW